MNKIVNHYLKNFKYDLPAGLEVFFVALPLCLGISFASGAPVLAGVLTGIIGGMVVSFISGSSVSVSGPAAGLTVIIVSSLATLNSYNYFLAAVVLAGIIQIVLGLIRAGNLSNFFPSSVIKGMMAAIGIILILKQIPHAFGYDKDYVGDFTFFQSDEHNTLTTILVALNKINIGATIIFLVCMSFFFLWNSRFLPKPLKVIPVSQMVVWSGVLMDFLFDHYQFRYALRHEHLVNLPEIASVKEIPLFITTPNFDILFDYKSIRVAFTIAMVASIETLLSIEAIDKLHPERHVTPKNRELIAQGVGNILSGLIGGIPMTSVVVRSSANINAGGKTRMSSFFHGLLILISLVFLAPLVNMIPLSALASILIYTGYKLCNPDILKQAFKNGWQQFILFTITVIAILFTDLLIGISIGTFVGMAFIIHSGSKTPFTIETTKTTSGTVYKVTFAEQVSFLSKNKVISALDGLPTHGIVEIDASKTKYMDHDIAEAIHEFKERRNVAHANLKLTGVRPQYSTSEFQHHLHVEQSYERLFINNRLWVEDRLRLDPNYFNKMAIGQSPKYLFIGCSDSRVPANEITGTEPGEMFVHRNIANMVVHTDVNLMSVLQYAVDVLKVEHVIVCGHYGCGGVKAAVDGHYHGLVDKWLLNIKDVYRHYFKELDEIKDEEERHRKLVELNVREQVYNLSMTASVQKAISNGQKLQVHGWVYDIREGLLKDLNIDLDKDFKEIDIYRYNKKEDFI